MSQITSERFDAYMTRAFGALFDDVRRVAVGVSGGADSMALLWCLQRWAIGRGVYVHVLSVDHGLREAAATECAAVAAYCDGFEHLEHVTLHWDAPSDVRVQEEARKARYSLMFEHCNRHGISYLFLGHHADDQAETFLFRLAKGSGLDGLSGMRAMQIMGDVTLCRPFLNVPKDELVESCEENAVPYFDDPSNEDDGFARVRLRRSMDVLSDEGLSVKRLGVTASRMERARYALDEIADNAFKNNTLIKNTNRIEFDNKLCLQPDEIVLRVLLLGIDAIGADRDYAPRMEKVEDLAHALKYDLSFRKRTLGGVIFERDGAAQSIILTREKHASEA